MNVLFELTDKDIGMEVKEVKEYKTRIAARGIIINDKGRIAIQVKNNTNEYKLIGGGIEDREEPEEGFLRETLEETGCKVQIVRKLGITIEYITLKSAKQLSHIFIAKVLEDSKMLDLTVKEKCEGAKLIWVEPKKALELIKDSYNNLESSTYSKDYDVYRMKFISLRDRKILEYYIDNCKNAIV